MLKEDNWGPGNQGEKGGNEGAARHAYTVSACWISTSEPLVCTGVLNVTEGDSLISNPVSVSTRPTSS